MAFLRNYWYAGAWSKDIGEEPFARTILNEVIVFFRRIDGSLVAIADRCCHRALPLSMGKVIGDNIQCGYHGLEFNGDGACVAVPGQSRIPPGASVRSYPVIEKWNVAWIWMGDPALADEEKIPNTWWLDDPGWTPVMGCLHLKADYRLLVDNLMDLTHVTYVHKKTISGDPSEALIGVDTTRDGDRVTVGRWMLDIKPPPMFVAAGGFTGNVDRWQIVNWQAPAAITLDIGCADAGSGAPEGDRSKGISMWSTHLITPETETTTHYHWCYARNYKLDDAETSRLLAEGGQQTFMEDVEILEKLQETMLAQPGTSRIDINIDNGPLQVRRIMSDLLQKES